MNASLLCAECGASVGAPSATACPRCGAARDVVHERVLPTGPEVDAAWSRIARATLAFLGVNLALRGAAAIGQSLVSHALAALFVTALVLAVYRALRRRNVTVLAVWSWALAAAVALSTVGAIVWWRLTRPPAWRMALALTAVALAATYARALFMARRAVEGTARKHAENP